MAENVAKSPLISMKSVSVFYGSSLAVKEVSLDMYAKSVQAFIGPSGCGKSSLLRCINRMNDFIMNFRMEGTIGFCGRDLYDPQLDPVLVRRKVGMVFQKANPFPCSIAKNITWGPRLNGYKGDLSELVESSLRASALWEEVKDRLNESGLSLSGGQQQRLCIARTIAMNPEVILMDEPCASLDPLATSKIEELITELKKKYCIAIVTHNMQQAMRISDYTAFMYRGELIEAADTKTIYGEPRQQLTVDYVSGKFG